MENEGFYNKLRKKILDYSSRNGRDNLWIKYLLLAPDFFYLLCKLSGDGRIPSEVKFKINIAMAYFINPLDLIPDFFISVGYLDDIVVACFVLSNILKYISPGILNEHWPAKRDVVEVIEDVNAASEKIIEKDILGRITSLFGNKT